MTRDPNTPFHVANDDDARQERRRADAARDAETEYWARCESYLDLVTEGIGDTQAVLRDIEEAAARVQEARAAL